MTLAAVDGCPHGMPGPAACVDCMYETGVGPRPEPPVTVEHRCRANHSSQCPECDLPIFPGMHIAQMSTGAWVHNRCAEDAT